MEIHTGDATGFCETFLLVMTTSTKAPDLVELRSFCVAAETGSLGRAAIRLQISQPALTKRLQSLERSAGVLLLERSRQGVSLTPAGRRLYEQARRVLEQADALDELLVGLGREEGPIHLAASHSSFEAFVANALAELGPGNGRPVELVSANSLVVRELVADGRADIGVAARRPGATPNPAVRELHLADDLVVCAVPPEHPWARRGRISQDEFLRTPIVVRDPASNARWTMESVLGERGLEPPPYLVQAATPIAARREALARNAPLVLSRHVLGQGAFKEVEVDGLTFPRVYEIVLPAVGDPGEEVHRLVEQLREAVSRWTP